MLWEASIAMITIMLLMWAAAIWSTFTEDEEKNFNSINIRDKKAA